MTGLVMSLRASIQMSYHSYALHVWLGAKLLLMSLVLSGCASLSKDECLVADWQTIGYEDGLQGRSPEQIGAHRKACAEYGVIPDLTGYQAGRAAGLAHYCEPGNGYRLGRAGESYQGVCASYDEIEFLRAYQSGYELYRLSSQVERLDRQIRSKQQRQLSLSQAIRAKEAELVAQGTSSTRRSDMLAELRALEREALELEHTVHELAAELRHLRGHLTSLELRRPSW